MLTLNNNIKFNKANQYWNNAQPYAFPACSTPSFTDITFMMIIMMTFLVQVGN